MKLLSKNEAKEKAKAELDKIEYIGISAASGDLNNSLKGALVGGFILGPLGALSGAIPPSVTFDKKKQELLNS